jgi:hypothetical protein
MLMVGFLENLPSERVHRRAVRGLADDPAFFGLRVE